jgi:hypothetical protein
MTTIFVKDDLRAQVEAASGGQVTVLYTTSGHPCYMAIIPRFNLEDIDAMVGTGVHPAFVVNGVQKSEIFIGQYHGVIRDGQLLSIPGVAPTTNHTMDQFATAARNNGTGWHLLSNAERAALALWANKAGTMPRGNTSFGLCAQTKWETGRRVDHGAPGDTNGSGVCFTGSGPASWRHNGLPTGIADLCGNVWEYVAGVRLVDGEVQFVPNNDAAAGSADFKAITADGNLATPGAANTLKWDINKPVDRPGDGELILSEKITNQTKDDGPAIKDLFAKVRGSVQIIARVPALLKAMALFPARPESASGDKLFVRNNGERIALAGGAWDNGNDAGIFALDLSRAPGHAGADTGGRCAFVL